MRMRNCCEVLWAPVGVLMLWSLIAFQSHVAVFADEPKTGKDPHAAAQQMRVSARLIRGPDALMKEFQSTLPLSPIQGTGALKGFPFQQAVLSRDQVAEAVHWTEKQKSLSVIEIPQAIIPQGKEKEIELLKERVAEMPVPQTRNGIERVSLQQMSEGIKLRLSSSRRADQTLLKSELESKEFVSLREFKMIDSDGKEVARNAPETMKVARFQIASTVSDGQTLAVSGFSWNGGTQKTEAIVILLEVSPVENR